MKFFINCQWLFCAFVITLTCGVCARRFQSGEVIPSYKVDWLVVTMEWPQGECEYVNSTHRHTCVVPQDVAGWTLHGLWPTSFEEKYLQYCNDSVRFDWNKIADMKGELMKYWPNLYPNSEMTDLWRHEYEKHGSCAANIAGLQDEKEYFQTSLMLLHKYDPARILKENGIVPREEPYEAEDVINAVKYGFKSCPECSHHSGIGEVLVDVEVCLNKNLELIDCPYCSYRHRCRGQVHYHPLNYQQ